MLKNKIGFGHALKNHFDGLATMERVQPRDD